MSLVYFKTNDDTLVAMDSETSIEVSKSNTVTSSSVMSTRTAGDDLISGNITVSVQGVVTYSKTASQISNNNPTPSEWVDLIEDAIASKARFTLVSAQDTNGAGKSLLKSYPNMVIQDYGYVVDKYLDTITARITFREVFVTNTATVTYLARESSSTTKAQIQKSTKDGKGSKTDTGSSFAVKVVNTFKNALTSDVGENTDG